MNQRFGQRLTIMVLFGAALVPPAMADAEAECARLLSSGDHAISMPDPPSIRDSIAESARLWTAAWTVCQTPAVPVPLRAHSAKRWSDVLSRRGENHEAASVLSAAVDLVSRSEGPHSKLLIPLLIGLTDAEARCGELEAALQTQIRLLELRTVVFGSTTREVAESLETIGFTHQLMGNLPLAESHFRQAIAVAKEACGNRGILLGGAYDALFNLLRDQPGREAEAAAIQKLSDNVEPDPDPCGSAAAGTQ